MSIHHQPAVDGRRGAFPRQGAGASLEQFLDEARAWAIGPYATALLKGQKLQGEERAAIRRQLARFTGLSETYLDQADLRVSPDRFYKQLLRDRGLVDRPARRALHRQGL